MSRTYNEESTGGITFHTVFDGKFAQRVEAGAEGAIGRKLTAGANEGTEVFETYKSGIIGMLTSGCIAVKEFGAKKVQELQLNIDQDAQLQIPMYLLKGIAECLPNLDLSKEVKVGVFKNKRGKAGINISQEEVVGSDDWTKVESFYTKWIEDKSKPSGWRAEGMNGLPEVTYDEDDEEWDFSAQDKFLKKAVREFFSNMEEANVPDELPEGAPEDEGAPF